MNWQAGLGRLSVAKEKWRTWLGEQRVYWTQQGDIQDTCGNIAGPQNDILGSTDLKALERIRAPTYPAGAIKAKHGISHTTPTLELL